MKHLMLILLSIGLCPLSILAQIAKKAEAISIYSEVASKVSSKNNNSDLNNFSRKLSEPDFLMENNNTGINFHQGSWKEALELARKEGKLIFLDISTSWCPPCKMLKENTFPNKEVGNFYNANFINVAVDGEKGEGVTLARKFNISAYPTLMFINPEGKIIGQTAGYRNPAQFIELGKQIVKL